MGQKSELPAYQDSLAAPMVYFDMVGAIGTINGTIEIELAARVLTPSAGWRSTSKVYDHSAVAMLLACGGPTSRCFESYSTNDGASATTV